MLERLHLKNVGLAPDLRFEPAKRLNLITGDNGLGKSFLLDVVWWALTRTWSGTIALRSTQKGGTIEYVVHGKGGAADPVISKFHREDESCHSTRSDRRCRGSSGTSGSMEASRCGIGAELLAERSGSRGGVSLHGVRGV